MATPSITQGDYNMPELEQVETPANAGFVTRGRSKNKERIAKDEQEIEEMEKQLRGETEETPKENPEEAPEPKADKEEDAPEENLKGEERTYKKRYGDLRRHQQKVEKELKEELETLKGQITAKSEGLILPKSDEDITAWMKKYPDVAGIVKALVAKETNSQLEGSKKDLEELRNSQTQSKLDKARQSIVTAHPDFEDLEGSDEFHDWVDEQPKWIADALFENADEPAAVIRVIDLYKSDSSGITPQKKADKDASSSVKTKGRTNPDDSADKGKIRESDVAKMSDRDYEKNEAAILDSMAKGTFVYDLSGGAR